MHRMNPVGMRPLERQIVYVMPALSLIWMGQSVRLSEFSWLRTGLSGHLLWTGYLSDRGRCAAWS